MTEEEKAVLNATWNALPDFCGDEDILAVIDTSGSMYHNGGQPAAVALSLGLYLAEHNKGRFRNRFIEFSAQPQLIPVKGKTFVDKLRYVLTFHEIANTNLQAVFDLVLRAAIYNRLSQEDLPSKLVIISDMEFDDCVEDASETNFQWARRRFAERGYKLPDVVFWNVDSRSSHQPVTMNEQGVQLVSGVTPQLFAKIAGGNFSPYSFMIETLMSERYEKIVA